MSLPARQLSHSEQRDPASASTYAGDDYWQNCIVFASASDWVNAVDVIQWHLCESNIAENPINLSLDCENMKEHLQMDKN